MTLNGVMAVTLRYFSEFGKPTLQKTICGGIYARVHCIFSACTMSSRRKFTFVISSPDEFLVIIYSYSEYIWAAACLLPVCVDGKSRQVLQRLFLFTRNVRC